IQISREAGRMLGGDGRLCIRVVCQRRDGFVIHFLQRSYLDSRILYTLYPVKDFCFPSSPNMAGMGEVAAVIQLIQLGGTVVNRCYTYLQSARNAPVEIMRTISEVNALKGILEHLQTLATEGAESRILTSLNSLMGPQGACEECMAA